MFENRMSEDLVLVQLDLDTIFDDVSTHGLIIPICHQIEVWGIDNLLDKHVFVNQKVYDFTPTALVRIIPILSSLAMSTTCPFPSGLLPIYYGRDETTSLFFAEGDSIADFFNQFLPLMLKHCRIQQLLGLELISHL